MKKLLLSTAVLIITLSIGTNLWSYDYSKYKLKFKCDKNCNIHCKVDSLKIKYEKAIDNLKKKFNAYEKWKSDWSLTIGADYSEDNTTDTVVAKINSSIDISKGNYPGQFRFNNETGLRYGGNSLSEELSSFLVNYDYYLISWENGYSIESYAFMEKFSNSYLSIDERYEIGFGLKLEYGHAMGSEDKKIENLWTDYVKAHKNYLKDKAQKIDKSQYEEVKNLIKHKKPRIKMGIALSFFKEIEETDSKIIISDPDTINIEPRSEDRFRIVVRPSFFWQVSEIVHVKSFCYLKFPLGNPIDARIDSLDVKWLDYRINSNIKVGFELKNDKETDVKKVILFVSFSYLEDNAPAFSVFNSEVYQLTRIQRSVNMGIEIGL